MDVDTDLAGMDAPQLRQALSEAELTLEDVLEEKEFTLGQTGVHIGANELARLKRSWERDEERLQGRIEAIKTRIAELEGQS